jgi:hypothetical protein
MTDRQVCREHKRFHMPTITTLGHPSKRIEFTYTGSVKDGVTLHFERAEKHISSDFLHAILKCFKGTTVRGGFSTTNPTSDGLGIWVEYYSAQLNTEKLYPRHASHIAAILVHEGYATSSLEGNAIVLNFPDETHGYTSAT